MTVAGWVSSSTSNRASHDIIRQGLELIGNLEHRGALGADPETGDGCGILIQIPHDFFAKSVLLPDSVFHSRRIWNWNDIPPSESGSPFPLWFSCRKHDH
ncbi:MAG: hypothetical protein Ct9H90mP9_3500 [Pseudomonadota bacterium]|nr:MAG: hypothetical protein Ct9H90mP9_3500 [Pseudomonadota bacterium]